MRVMTSGRTVQRNVRHWPVLALWAFSMVAMSGCSLPGSSTATIAPASILGWSPGITRSVPLTAPLAVYFTRAVDHASVERSWRLTPHVAGAFTWAGTSVAFTPARAMRPGSYYRLAVGRGARDDRGRPLTNALDVAFSTGDPLKVTSVTPSAGTVEVPLNGLIAVTFNHPMVALAGLGAATPDPPGWEVSISPQTTGHGSWLGTSTWVFHPAGGLVPSSRYSVALRGSVRDAWGEPLGSDLQWSFTTAGPAVVDASPRNGERYADPNGSVRVTFNQPMDRPSTDGAFSVDAGGKVPGTVSWQGNTLVFTPDAPLDSARRYTVTVAPSASAANGRTQLKAAFRMAFGVAPPPRVVSTVPAQNATTNNYGVDLHFSSPMRQGTLDSRLAVSPPLSGMNTSVYGTTYSIYGSFQPSTIYTVTVGRGAQDRFGRALPDPYTLRFTTSPLSPSVSLMGRPGVYSGISFAAGRVVDAPVQTVNLPRVHYTFLRTDPAAAMHVAQGCGSPAPAGTTLRDWTAQLPHPLDRAQSLSVRLAQRGGAPLAPGVYWLGAQIPSDVPGAQNNGPGPVSELVVASNVGITTKSSSDETLVWVTSAGTGQPLAGVTVKLLNGDGKTVSTGSTDRRGVVPFHDTINDRWAAVVDDGRHFGMVLNDWVPQSGPSRRFNPMAQFTPVPDGAYAYTDRPIYRPGQKVYFRAVLWRDTDAAYSLYGSRAVQMQAFENPTNGGGGGTLYSTTLRLDHFGSVSGSFRLPVKAATGTDGLTFILQLGKSQQVSAGTQFSVAEYRKPEFLTAVRAGRSSYVDGETIGATAEVRYVFGAPVTGQRVTWTAYSQDRFVQPPGWESYSFGDQDAIRQRVALGMPSTGGPMGMFGSQIAQGEGTTDDVGRLRLSVPVDLARQVLDQTVTIEATVTDVNHQSVSGRVQVAAHRAGFSVGLLPSSWVGSIGRRETVDVAAVRDDGSPVSGEPLTATVYRRTYTSELSATQRTGGYWQQIPHDREITSQHLTTDGQGRASVAFTPKEGGDYYVVIEGKDAAGKVARSGISVYAGAEGFSDFGQSSNTVISLQPDRASYRVGETAHVLVAAPFDRATALITLERGSIRDVRVQQLRSNSSIVDVPVTLGDLPNVYVAVTIYRGWRNGAPPDWRYGVANLHVKVDPRRLVVHLAQDRTRYHPGDTVSYTVKTTDVRGRPVSAQVSLALVDTAVLALQDESNPDILQALYGERVQSVTTASDGAASVDALQSGQAAGIGPVCGLGGGGGGLGGVAPAASGLAQTLPPGVKVRRRFADTAYWTASLVTDGSGTATVHVPLPDNLTTWRLDARAVSADQRVGRQTIRTQSTQDLILRPVTPRFFLQGDRLSVGVVVNNNLSRPVDAGVSVEATGLALASGSTVKVTVPAHGERLVLWPVEVQQRDAAGLTFRASPSTGGVQGDAVHVDLPVHPPLTDETVATSGQVFGATRQLVVLPREARSWPGALTVQLSSSLIAGVGAAYPIFRPTPYDSNEDIADRVLAAAALRSVPAGLTGLSSPQYAGLPSWIDDGVKALAANQLGDGGWPWYNDGNAQSAPTITADVVEALRASHASGRTVARALQGGLRYLHGVAPNVPVDERIHILSVLALAGRPDRSAMSAIYANTVQRAHLDPGSVADLAQGLKLSGQRTEARSLVSTLEGQVMVSATGAHWEGATVEGGRSAVATTIAALAALVRLAPGEALVPAAARWLVLARQGEAWDCPPVTAHALTALTAYARAAHEGKADYRYRVTVDNHTTLAGAYASSETPRAASIDVPAGALRRGSPSALVVRREAVNGTMGRGPMYYVAQLRYFLPATAIAARAEGIAVGRRYLSLAGQPVDSGAAGSVVKVELTITTNQTLTYLHVDDPIPGGLEPIDQSLKTSRQGLFPAPFPFVYGRSTDLAPYLAHTDLRDDRVSLYAVYLPPGTYTYTYLAQATISGRYDVAPSHAEETFFPEVFGRSAGQSFTVR